MKPQENHHPIKAGNNIFLGKTFIELIHLFLKDDCLQGNGLSHQ